jgi:hypothetical protein
MRRELREVPERLRKTNTPASFTGGNGGTQKEKPGVAVKLARLLETLLRSSGAE